jgi:alanyl-tRNA synthetase
MRYDEAIKAGALAFFEDKYDTDAEVRVLRMGDASTELCGGTHVSNIGDIGSVVIASESSVAAGIRRIKMFASVAAAKYLTEKTEAEAIAAKEAAEREAQATVEKQRKQKLEAEAMLKLAEIIKLSKEESGRKILITDVSKIVVDVDADILKSLAEAALKQLGSEALVALIAGTDKVMMVVAASDSLVKSGVNAGNIVREAAKICGGGGGGRPNFAQAGAKDLAKIPEALEFIRSAVLAVKV